jgi:ATP synthase protein I
MNQQGPDWEFEDTEPEVKPLSAQEAQVLLKRLPRTSLWLMVLGQALAGLLVAVIAALLGGAAAGWSAAYGALAVVLPAAVFARALVRSSGAAGAGAAMAKLFGWEFVKLVLCIAMLAAAPRVVPNLSWLALLAGMVVAMKTYWVALIFRRPGV